MNILQPDIAIEQRKSTPLRYRPDIDGLRAVAVLLVLAFHAFPKIFRGGFIGVDIFFVISGYLITGIIYREMVEKRFSVVKFYQRRIRRIFPALLLVLAVTFAIGWYLLPPRDMQSLGSNIAGSAAFVQNFVLLDQTGYFDLAADKKPLLHIWSLGIEEQYYIFWPFLLLLIWRKTPNLLATIWALLLASLIACIVVRTRSEEWAFYSPVTRAWELLVGSALAVWEAQLSPKTAARMGNPGRAPYQNLLALLSTLAILVVASINAHRLHPGVLTIVPVAATAYLIGSTNTWIHRHLLSSSAVVFIGLISYPLYLWHYPLFAYARIRYIDGVPPAVILVILLASGLLAWLTYRLIERPIRFGNAHNAFKIGALLAGMAAIGVVGLVADETNGLPMRIPDSIRPFMLTGAETSAYWQRGKCLLLPEQNYPDFAPECAGDGRRPLLLIWGDSYGAALYPGLEHFAKERGYSVAEYTASACPPLIGYVLEARPFCKGINDFVLQRISQLKPDVVIFDSTWMMNEKDIQDGLERTVPLLNAMGIRKIVMMGVISNWLGEGLSANVLDYYFENGHAVLPERTWYRSNDVWTRQRDVWMENVATKLGIQYISTRNVFCDDNGCLARIGPNGSQLTAFDPGHLTVPGAIFLASHTLDRILEPKRDQSPDGKPR